MSGLERVGYNNFPMSRLYEEIDVGESKSPSWAVSLVEGSIGVVTGLQARCPVSSSSWSVKCLWLKNIPSPDVKISNPRKYLSDPRSLSLKRLSTLDKGVVSLRLYKSKLLLTPLDLSFSVPMFQFRKTKENTVWENFVYHWREACRRP